MESVFEFPRECWHQGSFAKEPAAYRPRLSVRFARLAQESRAKR
ncbi:hypothetical protein C725_2227 [Pacificimonas flava]|uniref:Uncharacterized protein n=1 Tax=Pacificimonas flava TaxID=1234595 RepID=M2TLF7_9SPHN|nr:hypothetical protein C725_2227 [Pacificimonas flava]